MTKSDAPTLENLRKASPKLQEVRVHRASDFLTEEEQNELRAVNIQGRKARRKFDDVDAYVAEIIARFGWDVYQLWNEGRIENKEMQNWILAERAREKSQILGLYSLIYSTVSSCVKVEKGKRAPKGIKLAQKLIKSEEKIAKGEF